jgi:Phage gp6-like head-tail connector protein
MDRVPIGTIPGLTSGLTGIDILIGTLGVGTVVSRAMLRHTNYDDGGATNTQVGGEIRNEPGGLGQAIGWLISDQTQNTTVTGALPVTDTQSIYLRVLAGSMSMNLTGWIEVSPGANLTGALTDLPRVKQFLNIDKIDEDARLNELIAAVSSEIQSELGLKFTQTTATGERHSGGSSWITLHNYPLISVASLVDGTVTLTEGDDFQSDEVNKLGGIVYRVTDSDGNPTRFTGGTRQVVITYDHGYGSVPQAVKQAATELVAWDYNQEKRGGRFGTTGKTLDTGGGSQYTSRLDLWDQQSRRFASYRRGWAV